MGAATKVAARKKVKLAARVPTLYRHVVRSFGRGSRSWLVAGCVVLASACTKGAPPASLLDSGSEPSASASAPDAAAALAAPLDAASPTDAGAVDELQARGKKLFEAIQKDEPDIALQMFFPREPFVALKDMKDPAAYWDKLVKQFKAHIHAYHKKLGKRADEATFDVLELNTKTQVYVAPKKEFNKTGYNKVTKSRLRYKLRNKSYSFEIAVMIDNDGKWYVTHLKK